MMRWIVRLAAAVLAAMPPLAAAAQAPPRWATLPEVPPLPAPDDSGLVRNGGAQLYYAVFNRGGGAPVILLHGGFDSSRSWGFEVPRLDRRHEVVVIDTRGHGRSTRPPGPLSYEDMASDVIAVMNAIRIQKAWIVGVSDGGIVGLILAVRHPERVAGLFAWGSNFNTHAAPTTPPDPALEALGARFMARMKARYRAVSPTPDGFAALREALMRLYATEPNLTPAELGSITAPTVVADGAHEQFIARAHTERLARLIPGARLVILPDVSHGGATQDPEAFHRAVAAFLDGAAAGARPAAAAGATPP